MVRTQQIVMAAAVVGAIVLIAHVYRQHKKAADKFNPDEMNWPSNGVVGALGYTYPYYSYAGQGNLRYPFLS